MSTALWSAIGCAVAGAAVGRLLPSIGDMVVHGRDGRATGPPSSHSRRLIRITTASLTTAVLTGWFGYQLSGLTLVAWCWLTITGVCLAQVDLECHRLPRVLVGAMAVGGTAVFVLVAIVDARLGSLLTAFVAAAVTSVAATVIAIVAPGQIGGGDITLLPALALYLGWCGWSTVLLGLITGTLLTGMVATVAVVLGRARRGTRIPAGPSLILGALAAIALGIDTGSAQ